MLNPNYEYRYQLTRTSRSTEERGNTPIHFSNERLPSNLNKSSMKIFVRPSNDCQNYSLGDKVLVLNRTFKNFTLQNTIHIFIVLIPTRLVFTCSKLTIQTVEQGVKYVQS